MTRSWLALACIAVLVASGCTPEREGVRSAAEKASARRPRHVVLISLDTTRADHMGFYGNARVETPSLDRLAGESIVFEDFMSVAPSTLAAHMSMFTGTYPHTHGAARNGFVVNDANVLLTEVLREHGFATAAFIASFALASRFNFNQGFEHYDETFDQLLGRDGVVQNERSAAKVTDAVLGFLDSQQLPEHQFLFVHYFDPHLPYDAPAPYDTLYDERGGEGLPSMTTESPPTKKAESRTCPVVPSPQDALAERVALQYAAEISYMDEHVGRLIEGLRQRGILEHAAVIVTSDHGENFWEHPDCFNHGWDTYQTALRAVGVVRLPGALHAGTRIRGPVSNLDIVPTVLRLLDIEAHEGVAGTVLQLNPPAEPDPERARFGQATKPWDVERDQRWKNLLKNRCIRQGKYKLIQTPYQGTEELYDLESDPHEQHDLLVERPQEVDSVVRALRPQLEAWAAAARPLPTGFDRQQQEETKRRLESLGYLGGP